MTALETRRPTGAVPWPLVLIEGSEKSGKSYSAALFTASPKVGRCLWLDWGEGAGDEYAAIEGTDYELIKHNGTWPSIYGQIVAARDVAAEAVAAGEKPVVLIIDSMTAEWESLKDWVDGKARRREANIKKLERDPDAEVSTTPDLWNLANSRHRDLMRVLMRFPGICVVTARGGDQMEMENGKPTSKRVWKVDGQKNLAFDASVWVRLSRDEHPLIVGARSVHAGIVPGVDKAKRVPDLTLEQLVFDILKCDPKIAHVRDFTSVQDKILDMLEDILRAKDSDALNAIWREAKAAELLNVGAMDGPTVGEALGQRAAQLKASAKPAEPVEAEQGALNV